MNHNIQKEAQNNFFNNSTNLPGKKVNNIADDARSCKTSIDGANINVSQKTLHNDRKMSETLSNTSQSQNNDTFHAGAGCHCTCKRELDQFKIEAVQAVNSARIHAENMVRALANFLGVNTKDKFQKFYENKLKTWSTRPEEDSIYIYGSDYLVRQWRNAGFNTNKVKEWGQKLEDLEKQLAGETQNHGTGYSSYQDTPIQDFSKKLETPIMKGGNNDRKECTSNTDEYNCRFSLKGSSHKRRLTKVKWFQETIQAQNSPDGARSVFIRFGIGQNPNKNNSLDFLLARKFRLQLQKAGIVKDRADVHSLKETLIQKYAKTWEKLLTKKAERKSD